VVFGVLASTGQKRRGLGSCRRQDGVGVHTVGDGAMVDAFTVMQCGFRARVGSPAVTTSRRGGVDTGSGNATAGNTPSAKAVHGAVIVGGEASMRAGSISAMHRRAASGCVGGWYGAMSPCESAKD
jgi:hypothetical protein